MNPPAVADVSSSHLYELTQSAPERATPPVALLLPRLVDGVLVRHRGQHCRQRNLRTRKEHARIQSEQLEGAVRRGARDGRVHDLGLVLLGLLRRQRSLDQRARHRILLLDAPRVPLRRDLGHVLWRHVGGERLALQLEQLEQRGEPRGGVPRDAWWRPVDGADGRQGRYEDVGAGQLWIWLLGGFWGHCCCGERGVESW